MPIYALCVFAHKPRQIACVGFVGRGRVHAPPILSRDTGRNRARQVFSLVIASTISLTAKEKPRQNASRSPRFINSVWLSLIFWSMVFCCSVSVADNSCSWRITSFAVMSYSLPRTTSYSCGAMLP